MSRQLDFSAHSGKPPLAQSLIASTAHDGSAAYSPDGRFLAYTLNNDGSSAIYVKSIDGGDPVRLTDGKMMDRTPVWSPDGLRIAFLSERGGKDGIWTMSYLGGQPVFQVPISGGAAKHGLRKWSNDGEHLYSDNGGKLNLIDLNNGEVTDLGLPTIGNAKALQVSNDEKRLAFVISEGPLEQLWVEDLGDRTARRISDGRSRNFGSSWFPDSNQVAFCSNRTGIIQIYVYDIKLDLTDQLTFNGSNSRSPMVSPDNKQVKYLAWDRFEND